MSQDQGLSFHGPVTTTFDDGGVSPAVIITGSNMAALDLNMTTKVITQELTDGAEQYDESGRQLVAALTIDELNPADLDALEALFSQTNGDVHSVTYQFLNMPAAHDLISLVPDTAPATNRQLFLSIDVTGSKPVITVRQGAPAGTLIDDIINIT